MSFFTEQFGLFSAYFTLGAMAVGSVYAGSFGSLKTPKSTKALLKKARKDAGLSESLDENDEDEDEEEEQSELLNLQDAYYFPFIGSAALFSLFLLFKYASADLLNLLLGIYFAIFGSFAVGKYFNDAAIWTLGSRIKGTIWKISIKATNKKCKLYSGKHSDLSASCLALGVILSAVWLTLGRYALLNNLLGLAFAYNAITLLHLDSFVTGAILLTGLFFYDIFWVYGTPVMVSVAKHVDAPIKLVAFKDAGLSSLDKLLPASWLRFLPEYRNNQVAMLGLGDIVLPGIYVALALRYDLHRHAIANPTIPVKPKSSFPKPYFYTSVLFYSLGLLSTVILMHMTQKGTPALLFLSPAAILAIALTASLQNDWKGIRSFKVDPPAADDKQDEKSPKSPSKGKSPTKNKVAKSLDGNSKDEPSDSSDGSSSKSETQREQSKDSTESHLRRRSARVRKARNL